MDIKSKITTIKNIPPNTIRNEVQKNIIDFKLKLHSKNLGLSKDGKNAVIAKFHSNEFKAFLKKESNSVEDCLMSNSAITNHQKDGLIGKKGRIAKSLDFYSFYFLETKNQWYQWLEEYKNLKIKQNPTLDVDAASKDAEKDEKTKYFNTEKVIINTPKVVITPNKIIQIIRNISPVKKRVFSVLFSMFVLWFIFSISSFGDSKEEVCCTEKSKSIDQYITDIQIENISFFSTRYLNDMLKQLKERPCDGCNLKENLTTLKDSLYELAVKFNSIEKEQNEVEGNNFTELSKLYIKSQITVYEILLYLCDSDICTDTELVRLQTILNQLFELRKDF